MIYLSGLVGFLLVFTAEARVGSSSESNVCTETDQCLLFDLICKTDDYEVRNYSSVNWVSTDETCWSMDYASIKAFRRLFAYIKENNIKMTAPVTLKVSDKTDFLQTGTYTMSFLLPVEHQHSPIKPTDERVYINNVPGMKVYVRSYGGWMMSWTDKNQAETLSNSLKSVGAKYDGSFHYGVGYNSPMTLFNRHNEVWYVVQDEPVCGPSVDMDTSPIS